MPVLGSPNLTVFVIVSSCIQGDNDQDCVWLNPNTDDTEDLDYLCSKKAAYDPLKRSVRTALVDSAIHNKQVSIPEKPAALEALAHLSYLPSLALTPEERRRLAQEFLKLCRSARKREADYMVASDLFTGLAGLANLAKHDAAGRRRNHSAERLLRSGLEDRAHCEVVAGRA